MVTEVEFPARTALAPIDLTGALAESLLERRKERGDDEYAHFSDLGKCDLQVWARRRGLVDTVPRGGRIYAFELGHVTEAFMEIALRERLGPLGWQVTHGGLMVAHVKDEIEFDYFPEDVGEVLDFDPRTTVLGHPDFFVQRGKAAFVIDAKSTTFPMLSGVRKPPGVARMEYVLQTAGYAVGFDYFSDALVSQFGVWSACKSGGGDELVPYNTHEYQGIVLRRLRELLAVTGADAPAPEDLPPNYTLHTVTRGARKGEVESWMCGYCDYRDCVRNQSIGGTWE